MTMAQMEKSRVQHNISRMEDLIITIYQLIQVVLEENLVPPYSGFLVGALV